MSEWRRAAFGIGADAPLERRLRRTFSLEPMPDDLTALARAVAAAANRADRSKRTAVAPDPEFEFMPV